MYGRYCTEIFDYLSLSAIIDGKVCTMYGRYCTEIFDYLSLSAIIDGKVCAVYGRYCTEIFDYLSLSAIIDVYGSVQQTHILTASRGISFCMLYC